MHHLDDPMAYRNFIQMPPELYQELEQRITAEFQRDRTLIRDPVSPGVKLAVTLRQVDGDSRFLWVDIGAAGSTLKARDRIVGICISRCEMSEGSQVDYGREVSWNGSMCTVSCLDDEPAAALA